ncbi:hypothetical protein EJ04DRAFT_508932 [Polyplosphaeria fusca]|uniref:Uncharacterized protein n=1 Tax=Polyplosphaeria fusca TaxID=682080 RepID=A0A9P4R4Y8_9PLEO|nr:hypothetical protein EJ04DRAFT_508932 [Polyplosphaeria fusca]
MHSRFTPDRLCSLGSRALRLFGPRPRPVPKFGTALNTTEHKTFSHASPAQHASCGQHSSN